MILILYQLIQKIYCSYTHLASAKANHQISDEGVLSLSRAVAHHHTPAAGLSQLAATQKQQRGQYMLTNFPVCAMLHTYIIPKTNQSVRSLTPGGTL